MMSSSPVSDKNPPAHAGCNVNLILLNQARDLISLDLKSFLLRSLDSLELSPVDLDAPFEDINTVRGKAYVTSEEVPSGNVQVALPL